VTARHSCGGWGPRRIPAISGSSPSTTVGASAFRALASARRADFCCWRSRFVFSRSRLRNVGLDLFMFLQTSGHAPRCLCRAVDVRDAEPRGRSRANRNGDARSGRTPAARWRRASPIRNVAGPWCQAPGPATPTATSAVRTGAGCRHRRRSRRRRIHRTVPASDAPRSPSGCGRPSSAR
jgi:hypothetical protein